MAKSKTEVAKRDPRDIQLGAFTLHAVGLQIDGEPTFDDWVGVGQYLERCEGAVQWWIGDWLNFGEGRPQWGDKYEQAISLFNREYQTLANYKSVAERIEFSLRRENLSWSHHAALAYEDIKTIRKLLAAAEPEAPDQPPRLSVAEVKAELRKKKRIGVVEGLKGQAASLESHERRYPLIYADPPWQYDFAPTDSRAIENHYPTMPVDDICALPIEQIAMDDCLLLMWGTNPKLREALKVIEAWGFEYKTNAVWVKHAIGMGYYFRQRHELLMVATRGSIPTPEPDARPDSVIEADRERHSAKPLSVYELIDRMYPEFAAPEYRIELFQRKPRDGWSAWGNEVQG